MDVFLAFFLSFRPEHLYNYCTKSGVLLQNSGLSQDPYWQYYISMFFATKESTHRTFLKAKTAEFNGIFIPKKKSLKALIQLISDRLEFGWATHSTQPLTSTNLWDPLTTTTRRAVGKSKVPSALTAGGTYHPRRGEETHGVWRVLFGMKQRHVTLREVRRCLT